MAPKRRDAAHRLESDREERDACESKSYLLGARHTMQALVTSTEDVKEDPDMAEGKWDF